VIWKLIIKTKQLKFFNAYKVFNVMKTYQITQAETLIRTRVYEVDAISPAEAFSRFYKGDGKEISDTTEETFNNVEYNIKTVDYE
jgi:hypothetical protein